ncbi:MAG TPA: vitamin K epoxide reductase family protein [Candidatus Nanoarchaeia archaeon]|nr:vitamin K epoxide reductase family protein [Candidatus Nanoarchaeia archaeon]
MILNGAPEYIRILAWFGLFISVYFWNVYKGWMHSAPWLIPARICRKNVCSDVLKTYFARVIVIPNFYWGIVYYTLVLVWSFVTVPIPLTRALMLLSWCVVIFSGYLFYALVFHLRVRCNLCFVVQAINLVIALLLTLGS